MAYLMNLKVKKVSFVKRGANKREFFLAKSADYITAQNTDNPPSSSGEGDNSNNFNGGARPMRPEVRLRLGDILKKEHDIDNICSLLKKDDVLKATDAEIAEIRDFVSLIPPPPAPDPTLELEKQKAIDLAKSAEEARKQVEAEIAKMRDEAHKAEVTKWVETNCKYLNMDTPTAVEQILKAEKVDLVTAETLKKSFQSTSEALQASALLKEVGRSGEDGNFDPIGGNLVADISKVASEIQKSHEVKKSDAVMAAIKSVGGAKYDAYRKEFNRRARTY